MSSNSIPQFSMSFDIHPCYRFRFYIIAAILVIYLFSHYSTLVAPLLILLPVYFYTETKISTGIKNILDSATYFASPPTYLSLLSVALFLLSIACCIILYSIFSKMDFSFISYYFYCLLLSSTIFLLSTAFKCFSLITGFVDFSMIRRGFFGISQRLLIIFRFIILIPFWASYIQQYSNEIPLSISETGNSTKISENVFLLPIYAISSKKSPFLMIYLLMKAFMIIWLLLDFAFTIEAYNFNKKEVLVPVTNHLHQDDLCVICRYLPENPYSLPCGHFFCLKCITRWIQKNNTCPLCTTEFVTFKTIDFTNGDLPYSIFFLAF